MNNLYVSAKFNQLANANNPYQGSTTKALCVCSAGLLRSPSMAKFLSERGYNTRACGTSQEYALIPISHALIEWADEIHVVEEQADTVKTILSELGYNTPIFIYDIPDNFCTFDPDLMSIIEEQFNTHIQS